MIKWIGEHIWDFISRFRNDVIIESDTGAKPEVFIKNQANTSGAGQLIFERDYTTSSGKICGEISFRGRNDAGEEGYGYGFIQGKQKSVTQGSETGEMSFGVRSTGATRIGLKLEAGDDSQDVDVTLGHATTSTTTVVGGLTFDSVALTAVQTSAELSSPGFQDNDTSLMTAAAIDDRINAAGGGGSSLIHVDMPKYIAIYLFYVFNKDQWYTPPTYTTAITTSATIDGATLSAQMQARGANYIANSACKVKKVTLVFQMSSGSLSGDIDLEWALVKWTPQDDTANTATMTEMTITNHDGAFTETDVHTLTFTVTDNAASTLSAKDCIAFCVRTTDQTTSSPRILFYGHGNYEIELT